MSSFIHLGVAIQNGPEKHLCSHPGCVTLHMLLNLFELLFAFLKVETVSMYLTEVCTQIR